MSKGALYIVWGDSQEALLQRSLASLHRVHPELPVEVCRMPEDSTLLDKSKMCEVSPFTETVYLDADTIVMDRLDFGFRAARRFDLACCICECPNANRYPSFRREAIEYNTGVIFFTKAAQPLFARWMACVESIDSSIEWQDDGEWFKMECNDQAGFAKALTMLEISPYVLPMNWNLRPAWQWAWFGPIKVWHSQQDPPDWLLENNAEAGPMEFRGIVNNRTLEGAEIH